jgi:hypothetical protein
MIAHATHKKILLQPVDMTAPASVVGSFSSPDKAGAIPRQARAAQTPATCSEATTRVGISYADVTKQGSVSPASQRVQAAGFSTPAKNAHTSGAFIAEDGGVFARLMSAFKTSKGLPTKEDVDAWQAHCAVLSQKCVMLEKEAAVVREVMCRMT